MDSTGRRAWFTLGILLAAPDLWYGRARTIPRKHSRLRFPHVVVVLGPQNPRDAFARALEEVDALQHFTTPPEAPPGILLTADVREGARRLECDLRRVKNDILTYADRWPNAAYFACHASGHTIMPGQEHGWHNGSSFSVSAWHAEPGDASSGADPDAVITGDVPDATINRASELTPSPEPYYSSNDATELA